MITQVKELSTYNTDRLESELDGLSYKQFQRTYLGGYSFNFANSLSSTVDIKTKNYTNFYLTNEYPISKIINYDTERLKATRIVTTIKYGTQFLKFNNISPIPYSYNCRFDEHYNYGLGTFTNTSSDDTTFSLLIRDDNICNIVHTKDYKDYYLCVDADLQVVFVYEDLLTFDSNINPQDFRYLYADNKDFILLLKETENDGGFLITKINNALSGRVYTTGIPTPLKIERSIYEYPNISLDTSFITYNPDNTTNPEKSQNNLTNNYLLHNKFTYDSPNTDIIVLKNQLLQNDVFTSGNNLLSSRKYNSYVNGMRSYTSIAEGIKEEESDELELSYVFNNIFYEIKQGITEFTSPSSMNPFTTLNINDTKFVDCGSFSSYTPRYADKVYEISDDSNQRDNGQYLLCTWLSGSMFSEKKVWIDRYYYPDLITKEAALSSREVFDVTYDSYIENLIKTNSTNKTNVKNKQYFDTFSNLAFEPNKRYIYDRPAPMDIVSNPVDICDEVNYYREINKAGKMTFGFVFNGDNQSWILESIRNDINSGLTILKTNTDITITMNMYDSSGFTFNENSFTATINTPFKEFKENYLIVSLDVKIGIGYFFLNDKVIYTFKIPQYEYLLKKILYGDIVFYEGGERVNVLVPNKYFKDVKIYNDYLPIETAYSLGIIREFKKVDTIYITLPCGMRNSTDNIELLQTICNSTGFKSNNINIIVKNLNISNQNVIDGLERVIKSNLENNLPPNTKVNNIQFINFK